MEEKGNKDTMLFLIVLFFVVLICCIFSAKAFGQTVQREGNNFICVSQTNQMQDILTAYTYTIKEAIYPIWITPNGRCYIIRTSKNGNQYKQYLNKEICLHICKELNVEYKE